MHPVKYLWAVRALFYKLLMKKVGFMSYIGEPCFIEGMKGISIGNRVRIFPGVRIQAIGTGKIKICDNTAIEQNVHIISYERELVIGKNTTISANVFISNVNHSYEKIGQHVIEQDLVYKETVINENCFIGYGAVILPGTNLGKQCIVGANSVVKGIIPDQCVVAGNPAHIIKKYNKETMQWEKWDLECKLDDE